MWIFIGDPGKKIPRERMTRRNLNEKRRTCCDIITPGFRLINADRERRLT
jgi:hypothetical protein